MGKVDKRLLHSARILGNDNNIECIAYLTDLKYLKDIPNFEIIKYFHFIKAVGLCADMKTIEHLSKYNFVKYVTINSNVFCQIKKAKNLMNLDSFYQQGIYGQGINVAVIDTGVNPLPDFCMPCNRLIKFLDFVKGEKLPYDDNGHGTFISGVLLGNGLISKGKYAGIAPRTNLISLKALDKNGESGAFRVLEAMQWIFDNHKQYKIKVVCMSFGSEPLPKNDPLVLGAEMLWKAGIIVVVAGGNSGPTPSSIKSPGVSSRVITVGGLDDGRGESGVFKVADFSSRGPAGVVFKPDILAPSTDIISNNKQLIRGRAYTLMSGTSVATPMIAGVACLLVQKFPQARPDQIKSHIIRSGHRLNVSRNEEGFGWFMA